MHLDRVQALIGLALSLGGKRHTLFRTEWDISGNCSDSYRTELHGRPSAPHGEKMVLVRPLRENTPQVLVIHTRCRRCINCLRTRQRRWYGATLREVSVAPRTWFGTLTCRPEVHHVMLARARVKLAAQGVDFDTLHSDEQFIERHLQIGKELTKYIKRVRKNSGASLRYLLVAEAHQSGLPHYHMLFHETPDGGMVRHRHLSEAWDLGFENWRLSDPTKTGNPAYLCKYLAKSLSARVRASQRYGGAASDQLSYTMALIRSLTQRDEKETEYSDNDLSFFPPFESPPSRETF